MRKMKIAIFGGGIAGLTVAHELAECSDLFEITLYEKSNTIGGKAKSRWTQDGFPAEHSARTIHRVYYHLRDTLQRIPYDNTAQCVLGNVTPTLAGPYKFFMRENENPYVLPHYFPWTKMGLDEYAAFSHALKEMVPKNEIHDFLKKIFKLMQACTERRYKEFDDISWEDYLEAKDKSKAYYNCLLRLPEFYVAARGTARASSMGMLLARSIFFPLVHPFASQKSAADVFNGPSSDVFINPWGDYLKKLGVTFKMQTAVTKINMANNNIKNVSVLNENGKEEEVSADIYVFALPVEIMALLTKDEAIRSAIPTFNNLEKLSVEPSSGIQFFTSNDEDPIYLKGWTSFLDSPWAIIGINQSEKLWSHTHFKAPLKNILSLTWSNFNVAGVLYNKPAYACTAEEIKNEILAQVRLHKGMEKYIDRLTIHSWALDDCISFNENKLLSHCAPLFVPYPGSRRYQPEAYTESANVFLAGDYTNTGFDITTMEAANESGRRAVNAIIKKHDLKCKPCFVLDADHNGFAFLKLLDKLLYKMQRKS